MVKSSKGVELLQSKNQSLVRRGIEKIKVKKVVDSQTFEHEDNVSQVDSLNFWSSSFLQLMMKSPSGEDSETLPCCDTTSSSCSLI